jgi:hypothetical protein
MTRVEVWQDGDEWWTPEVAEWPPVDWIERPESSYGFQE